jgi:hypothetical protein
MDEQQLWELVEAAKRSVQACDAAIDKAISEARRRVDGPEKLAEAFQAAELADAEYRQAVTQWAEARCRAARRT